jgi:hypothetical protein
MAKKNERVVVNRGYFELIERKAYLLDQVFDNGTADVSIDIETIKEYAKLRKAWDKSRAFDFSGTEEPYKEPKT